MPRPLLRPLRPRRRGSVAAVASAVLTVALLGAAATTAQAADPAPTSAPSAGPGSSAVQVIEHPAVEVSVVGSFLVEPGRPIAVGTRVNFTYLWRNTGDVPLLGLQVTPTLAVGAVSEVVYERTIHQVELDRGYMSMAGTAGRLTTPGGAITEFDLDETRLPIPPVGPPREAAVEHPAMTVTVIGKYLIKPG